MAEKNDTPTTADSSSGLFGGSSPFIFGGNTPLTYEELQRRRAIALALASRQRGFPKNKGEGMTYLGESIGNALQGIGLDIAERRALAAGQRAPLVPGAPGAPGTGVVLPPQAVDPDKNRVPSAPQKTSQAPAAVEPAPTTTADAAVTPASMAAATEPQDAPGGGVSDLSQFATAGLTAGDFGTPAPPPAESPFPASVASRFSAVNDVLPPAQRPVPPVSVDPNMRAQLSGGRNAIDPSTMAQPQLAAFSRQASQPVPAPGTPLPMPRPPMPRDLANATPEEGGFNEIDAGADLMTARKRSIAGIESGGAKDPYGLATSTGKGDVAYGKYQILGKEIPDLTAKYLGKPMTVAQFRASPEAQDAVFTGEFGTRLVGKYGEEGAARAWYAGERGMQNPNATDRFGRLTVAGYGKQYLAGLDPNAPTPSGGGGGGGGGVPAVAQGGPAGPGPGRDGIALAMLAQQAQQPQQASPEENAPDARLLEIAAGNTRRPGSPFRATASLDAGRAGVVSDAPQPGLSPMGSLDPTASINARRDAITGASMGQPPATVPGVPQPDPTQSGPTAPATSGADLTGGSSNPPTVVDMTPAPPMGATAQATVPPGGYQSVPQPQLSRPMPLPPTQPPSVAPSLGKEPRQDPTVANAPPAADTPQQLQTKLWLQPTEQEQHAARLRQDPSNAFLSPTQRETRAAEATAFEEAGKKIRDAYNANIITENTRKAEVRKAWEEQQRQLGVDAPKIAGAQRLQEEQVRAAQREGKLKQEFGPDPAAALTDFKLEKEDVNRSVNILHQSELAKTAMNEGIITGYGANQKLDGAKVLAWMTRNQIGGTVADNTERFRNAVNSMLATGMQTLAGADATGRPIRFNKGAIDIAAGNVAATPDLQEQSIRSIISENERAAREKINNYEEKVQRKFRAFPELEADYQPNVYKTATPEHDKILFDSVGTPKEKVARDYYDKHFGTGAAELELARRARANARGGGP